MKKTQRIELFNTIKSTKVSFISITFFVALAVAVFLGLSWTGDETRAAIDRQMNDTHYYDLELIFPYGFTDDDIDRISQLDGVSEVEPTRIAYGTYNSNNVDYQVKIHQVNSEINTPIVVEGKLPEKVGEIAIKEDSANKLGISVGDRIEIDNQEIVDGSMINKLMSINTNNLQGSANDHLEEGYLKTDSFTVTAIVNSMQYIMNLSNTYGSTLNGAQPINALMYVVPDCFRDDAYSGYSNVYIRSDALRGLNTYSDEYKNACQALKESISDDILDIASKRYNSIKNKADATSDAIDNTLADVKHQLDEGAKQIKQAEKQLEDAYSKRDELEQFVNEARAQLEGLEPDNPIAIEIAKQIEESELAIAEIDSGIQLLETKIEQGKKDLEKLENEYANNSDTADSVKEALEDLCEYDCVIATREYNVGITSLEIVSECVDKLKYSMAMLFLIVGLLVCYSAVSRIVHSQSTRIGTKKALGMTESEISKFYLNYSGITAVAGSIIGIILATFFVEKVMLGTLGKEYMLYSARTHLSLESAVAVAAVEIALIMLCSRFACIQLLRQDAVVLLAGQAPSNNRERFFERFTLWKNRSLLSKTIINNCINDKRRVFATLVGVAGCTAMIVCSLMLKDNIVLGIQKQYDELFKFNQIVMFDENSDAAEGEISEVLDDNNINHAFIKKEMVTLTLPEGRQISSDLFVADDDGFNNLIKINQIGAAETETTDGIWVTHAYANEYGVKAGDKIEIVDSVGAVHRFRIAGFTECYLTRGLIIMSANEYEKEFGKKLIENAALISIDNNQANMLNDRLSNVDGYYAIVDYRTESWNFFESFTAISGALVAVYLILAFIMTLLVLLNLFVMFVEEKRVELIVLMINGFSARAAKSYIYRDTIYITFVGLIVGTAFGTMMGRQSISSFENAATAMIKTVDVPACLIASAITAALTAIMVIIAVRRVDKFELTDINRE